MATYLNTETWARRDAFEFYRGFDKPYFNVCTCVDVAALKAVLAERRGSLTLACYHLALRIANDQQPFRLRLEGGRVRVHERVHGSTTVLRDDESFGFAYLEHAADFAEFARRAQATIAAARERAAPFEPRGDESALLHFTSLPWLHFTSFSHARNWAREDSVPKFAFGRAEAEGARLWLPLSIEVHHALMDGLQVGRFVEAFEAALQAPADWL